MATPLQDRSILIVDDELAIRKSLQQHFREEGARADTAEGVGAARALLQEKEYELVLLDHRLPDGSGLVLLEELKKGDYPASVVMMTAYASTADAVQAMKTGAADYVMKPFDLEEMALVAERALEQRALRSEVARYRARDRARGGVQHLIGHSPAVRELREFVQRVASSGARTILISGESGTGKDVVARAIHYESPQSNQPFLNITCTALPETLLETELFGHEKGAFTDARHAKRGLFEEASGGTIFLDEIGDMPLSLQAKLLRFLESKSFRRVGGLREIEVDVRVIAATNIDLAQAIRAGRFRSDLYYRLNVIPIHLAPLRERLEDVKDLAEHFAQMFSRELRKPLTAFDPEALRWMSQYSWPGNVRELRNCVERAVLLAGDSPQLGLDDLPPELRGKAHEIGEPEGRLLTLPEGGVILDDLIKDLLDQSLEVSRGNKSKAAGLLGIHRDQVRYWVKKYELKRWIRTKKAEAVHSAKN